MRRLGIFMFYDPLGRVSPHMHTLLRAMAPLLDRLVFVANGPLDHASLAPVADLVTDLIERENTGFDVWAYKTGLEHVGPEGLAEYDEVVLFNYTFFVAPDRIAPMFEAMAPRIADVWAITEYRDAEKAFLQSYFMVTRASLHTSPEFAAYWEAMPPIEDVEDSLREHEFRFTPYFRKLGFQAEAFVEPEPFWDGNTTLLDLGALHDRGMPAVKYRAFTFAPNHMQRRGGRSPARNLEFIARTGAYAMDEIWDYLIHASPPDDLIASAGLMRQVARGPEAAPGAIVLARLEDPRTLDIAMARLRRIPPERVVIATSDPRIRAAAKTAGWTQIKTPDAETGLALALWAEAPERAKLETETGAEVLICLSDFPGERGRYSFLPQLFDAYWDAVLSRDIAPTLEAAPHLGLILPMPEAVDGRERRLRGLDPALRNWVMDDWPDAVAPAVGQDLWPWRGICALRGRLLADPAFTEPLKTLQTHHKPRPDEVYCGPEGALTQLTRIAGLGSLIAVPGADMHPMVLRAGLAIRQAEAEAEATARAFRAEIGLIRAPGGALDRDIAGLDAGPVGFDLLWPDDPGQTQVILRPDGQSQITLRPSEFVRHALDRAEIEEGRVYLRGWAFDQDNPAMPLYCGLVHNGRLLGRFHALSEPRHDVRDAFPDSGVQTDSGFDINRAAPIGLSDFGPELLLCFVDLARTKVALVAPVPPV